MGAAVVSSILGGGQTLAQRASSGAANKQSSAGEDIRTNTDSRDESSLKSANAGADSSAAPQNDMLGRNDSAGESDVETVAEMMSGGRINNTAAAGIVASPELSRAFTELTGIELNGTNRENVMAVQEAARRRAYAAQDSERLAREAADEANADEAQAAETAAVRSSGYESYIRGIFLKGGASRAEATEILSSPQMRTTWEQMTGKTLPESSKSAAKMIMETRRDVSKLNAAAQGGAWHDAMWYGDKGATSAPKTSAAPSQHNIDNANASIYNDSTREGGVNDGTAGSNENTGIRVDGVLQRVDAGAAGGQNSPRGAGAAPVFRLSSDSQKALKQRGVVSFGLVDSSTDSAAFSSALDKARAADAKNGWAVTPKTADELSASQTRLIMSADKNAGIGVAADGDIEAVFKNQNGGPAKALDILMPAALEAGGNKLDCYGEFLARIYAQYGFVPVARVEFNPEYANEGWTPEKGTPYIYFMVHNGDSANDVIGKKGSYNYSAEALNSLPTFGKDAYDAAYKYRDSLITRGEAAGDVRSAGGAETPTAAQKATETGSAALKTAAAVGAAQGAKNAAGIPQHISIKDYSNNGSPVWSFLDYDDTAAQAEATQKAKGRMTAEGKVVTIFQSTLPVGGATELSAVLPYLRRHFNPRSPWGERLLPSLPSLKR